MGTRGFIGFVAGEQEKIAYNHWDSYPSGLGLKVLAFAREAVTRPDVLGTAIRALRVVDPDSTPTKEDIQRFSQFSWGAAEHGGSQDLRTGQEWYDLLHETQGDIAAILEAGVIEDASGFPLDSLFAEWGYIIDTSGDGWLEVYEGFQKLPHDRGRFAARQAISNRSSGPYYPVALRVRWPLTALPSDEEFLNALGYEEEEG